jgi:hypothetical protein
MQFNVLPRTRMGRYIVSSSVVGVVVACREQELRYEQSSCWVIVYCKLSYYNCVFQQFLAQQLVLQTLSVMQSFILIGSGI